MRMKNRKASRYSNFDEVCTKQIQSVNMQRESDVCQDDEECNEHSPLIAPQTKRWVPTRIMICLMMFTSCWTNYACRLQMPILAVPMIKEQLVNTTINTICTFDESQRRRDINPFDPGSYLEAHILDNQEQVLHSLHRRQASTAIRTSDASYTFFSGLPFDWSPVIRGQLIASYGYGTVPGNFVGGWLSLRYGPRHAILWTSILTAIISLISPLLAQIHWSLLLISRVIIGFTGGITFPACHTMIAKWAPPHERSRFVWSLLGGTFGTIITYPMVAGIAESINWESGWYIPSLLMFIWIYFWILLAYDSPTEHPAISTEEKEYILTTQAGIVTIEKPSWKQTPLMQMMTSVPFLSLIICHFGSLFVLFFYQNSLMLYLTKALGFHLTQGGLLAGAPWAGRMLFGFFFSWLGDTVQRKEIINMTVLRKSATIFSHFLPSVFLILVGYAGCNFVLANIYLILALAFNSATLITSLSNNQDLAPNFAGFLYGIMNAIGSTSGFIIPVLVEEIAGKYGNPIDKWQILFWINASVCIVTMIVFIFGGSTDIQSWNEFRTDKPEEVVEVQENT